MMVMKKIWLTVSQNGKCSSVSRPMNTRKPMFTTIGMEKSVRKLLTAVSESDSATLRARARSRIAS